MCVRSNPVQWCECEHERHGTDRNPSSSGHPYGVNMPTTPVRTAYGTFNVCAECKENCPGYQGLA